MLGYLYNNKVGALAYNLFHTYTVPVVIIIGSLVFQQYALSGTPLAVGLIWTAHIAMDRMLGYGLKYPTNFKDTHLNRV
jgi:hypothetical protein